MPETKLSTIAGGSGINNFIQITSTGTFTVPPGIYTLRILLQGGGGNGGSSSASGLGGGSGAAGNTLIGEMPVNPNDVITLTIGASAGETKLEIGGRVLAVAYAGGSSTGSNSAGAQPPDGPNSLLNSIFVRGNLGAGTTANGLAPTVGGVAIPMAVSQGGLDDGADDGGGGGSSSYFGVGGNGGDGNDAGTAQNGFASPNFGAGGGGGGKGNSIATGGAGGAGVVQLWY
jgi:hypothetical protein